MCRKKTELTYARSIFCIIIVIVHVMNGFINDIHAGEVQRQLIKYLQILLLSATPCFIMLSETLLGMRYSKHLPKNFLTKRIKFILIPYIFFALFIIFEIYFDPAKHHTLWYLVLNILIEGKFFGWFVLVIFQFFILHIIFHKALDKMKPLIPIVVSFAISFAHAILMYYSTNYLNWWSEHYILYNRTIILNWLFYFVLGFYIGKYYDAVMKFVHQKIYWFLLLLVVSAGIIAINIFKFDVHLNESNRFDLFIFSGVFFVLIISLSKVLCHVHLTFIYLISEISFFVYLSHQIIVEHISRGLSSFVRYPFMFLTLTTIFTIGFCIGLAIVLSFIPYARIIVGRNTLYPMVLNNYSLKQEIKES
ncbi:hypothetical protein BEK99_00240 [Staphylococcus carnosus]|uniref:acyltransferase family protein n=1 Tax=Staphylococcus carnosus TaxID=1281 RepID=UPI00081A9D2C|nr:acyltransferase family protein [Staphylococcus carnosus]ANZ32385.1 hypothetical protein BEK99_00240 [Staphylococcus carnosus]